MNSEYVRVHSRNSRTKWILLFLILAMVVLHQDFWLWSNAYLVFGILPIGLAYHAAYSVLAACLMWLLIRFAWPAELEQAGPAAPERASPEERS